MPRDDDESTRRVHIMMYESDYDWYKAYFGSRDQGGFTKSIRKVLRTFRKQIEAQQK